MNNVILRPSGRHLLIHGKVQGVYYRKSFSHEAKRHGIKGWVRNRPDGAVEAEIYGEDLSLAALMAWARRGPPGAAVSHVEVSEANRPDGYADFIILPTPHA